MRSHLSVTSRALRVPGIYSQSWSRQLPPTTRQVQPHAATQGLYHTSWTNRQNLASHTEEQDVFGNQADLRSSPQSPNSPTLYSNKNFCDSAFLPGLQQGWVSLVDRVSDRCTFCTLENKCHPRTVNEQHVCALHHMLPLQISQDSNKRTSPITCYIHPLRREIYQLIIQFKLLNAKSLKFIKISLWASYKATASLQFKSTCESFTKIVTWLKDLCEDSYKHMFPS